MHARSSSVDSLRWVPSHDGHVPPSAVPAGPERNNPVTYVGRCNLNGRRCLGRVLPAYGRCYAFCAAGILHCCDSYEVLTSTGEEEGEKQELCWRRDFGGHVPDTRVMLAVDEEDDEDQEKVVVQLPNVIKKKKKKDKKTTTMRQQNSAPVQPRRGPVLSGFYNQMMSGDYEVLCLNEPCSLKYLAGKRVRDSLREKERERSVRMSDVMLSLERKFMCIPNKDLRHRCSSVDKLLLPPELTRYLRRPAKIQHRSKDDEEDKDNLDPNVNKKENKKKTKKESRKDIRDVILDACCPIKDNCICVYWITLTSVGLL